MLEKIVWWDNPCMPRFLIQIELRNASPIVSNRIRPAMIALGLSKSILGIDGAKYELPTGMYLHSTEMSVSDVLDWIKEPLSAIHADFLLVVTDSTVASWVLLKAP